MIAGCSCKAISGKPFTCRMSLRNPRVSLVALSLEAAACRSNCEFSIKSIGVQLSTQSHLLTCSPVCGCWPSTCIHRPQTPSDTSLRHFCLNAVWWQPSFSGGIIGQHRKTRYNSHRLSSARYSDDYVRILHSHVECMRMRSVRPTKRCCSGHGWQR